MKLLKLHIYGFGRFQDLKISLDDGTIQTFLGDNETGKSTLMAFIRCVFFGFPTRAHSELRYEPRLGGRYGGSITIETEKFGVVTVERVSGKAAVGDAKVYFDDGSIGGEDELKLIVGQIDRALFTGIYSFGLTDLQSIEGLDSDELNRFLYGVGFSGRNNLLDLEKKTNKTLHELYKPTGRKPVINERLKNVAEKEEKVLAWQRKLSQYGNLVDEREHFTKELQQVEGLKAELNNKYRYYQKLKAIAPIVVEKQTYEHRLQQLPQYNPFPEDGLERLEKLQESHLLLLAELTDVKNKLEQIDMEKRKIHVKEELSNLSDAIGEVRETGKLYESKREEKALLIQNLQFEQQEYELLKERSGVSDFEMRNIDISFLAEEKLTELVREEEASRQKEQLLQGQIQQVRYLLEEKEKQVESLLSELLDDKTRQSLQNERDAFKTEDELRREMQFVDQSLQQVTEQLKLFSVTSQKSSNILSLILIIVTLVSGIFLIANKQWQLSIPLFIITVCVVIFLLIIKKKPSKVVRNLMKQKQELSSTRNDIINELEREKDKKFVKITERLQLDHQLRERLSLKELNLKEAEENYQMICKEFDKWEITHNQLKDHLRTWALKYHYPVGFEASYYIKLLKMVEDLKKKERQLLHLQEKLTVIDEQLTKEEVKVKSLCDRFSLTYNKDHHIQHIEKLTRLLKLEQEANRLLIQYNEQEQQLERKRETLQEKSNQYEREFEKLYRLANVQSEEQFRQKEKSWRQSRQIQEKLRVLKSQIRAQVSDENELVKLEEDILKYRDVLENKVKELDEKINDCWEEEKRLHKEIASLSLQIKELEEGSNYSETLHSFENEKGILKEEMREWLFHRTVKLLIDEAKAVYEKERQPKVLKEALKLFEAITNGEYVQLFAPIGEERFIVERKDGLRFQPNELSQGTKEQLYLAIRLALAKVHSKEITFPLFIDDIFVNFDAKRRLQAISVLKKLSNGHQVIFFTCHPFMAKEMSSTFYTL